MNTHQTILRKKTHKFHVLQEDKFVQEQPEEEVFVLETRAEQSMLEATEALRGLWGQPPFAERFCYPSWGLSKLWQPCCAPQGLGLRMGWPVWLSRCVSRTWLNSSSQSCLLLSCAHGHSSWSLCFLTTWWCPRCLVHVPTALLRERVWKLLVVSRPWLRSLRKSLLLHGHGKA